jgi:alpha-galactosidase
MHRDSAVLRDHPEFALKAISGETLLVDTWLGPCAVLDCSHGGAAEWLRTTIATVVGEWGYTLLKLDALAFAAQTADRTRYHARGTTALGNVRLGLEIIRQAAGEDVFLLGCTCHFGPAIGLVDAMRVGPDVKATWSDKTRPSVRHAMRMSMARNWMHRRWWLNDPDCLVLRATDTELNAAEVRFLAAAVALSGGLVVSSDNLPGLASDRDALTRSLMPPAGIAAAPIEVGDGPVPAAWRARIDETRSLVGVLNWAEEPRWVAPNEFLEAGEVAFAPWAAQVLGKGDLLLTPHDGTLWQVSAPSATPRLVGDTGHINYSGIGVRAVSGRLQLRNEHERTRTVAVEARGRIGLYELQAGEARWFD